MDTAPTSHGSPRTAVVWRVLTAELARLGRPPLSVVDVGGGTGGFAVPLAGAGHHVTVVDPSPDALAALARRAAEAGVRDRVTPVQGDGDRLADLVPAGTVDLVLCHSLLEMVDDPARVLQAVAGVLRPGGAVSVLATNRDAAVVSRALSGRLAEAVAVLDDPQGRVDERDRGRRFDLSGLTRLVTGAGLAVVATHGVRVLADLVPATAGDAEPELLHELELRLSDRPPFRDIAAQLHLLARRRVDGDA